MAHHEFLAMTVVEGSDLSTDSKQAHTEQRDEVIFHQTESHSSAGALLEVCELQHSGIRHGLAIDDPVVGAQYRWSAQFAPTSPRFWGLFQGWMTVFAWITTSAASLAYLAFGAQALIALNNPSYTPQAWHTTLLMCAFIIPPVAANLWFKRIINWMETVGAIGHGAFWVVTMIALGVAGSRSSNTFVWGTLTNDRSGWTQPGVAFGIGLLPIAFPITSFDGVLHMSKQAQMPGSMTRD
ncbi:MAG: hypothetical protein Q9179_007282 [Wetmoreana sp. 5 TL-2023]